MNHLFVTQDFGPDSGGMARRHVELCRRFADADDTIAVSTVANRNGPSFDRRESYPIFRESFPFNHANRFVNQLRWARSITRSLGGKMDVLHCGNVRPVGYAVWWAHRLLNLPYLLYVNGGDLLRERAKSSNFFKRSSAREMFRSSAGVVATSDWVANLSRSLMEEIGVREIPPVATIPLGTDPAQFRPGAESGVLRRSWNISASAPLLLTVARLVPHKGQDTMLRALAQLHQEFPDLYYVMVGHGHYEGELRSLAAKLGIATRVIFAGALSESQLPEAYATSTIYVGPSRVDEAINAEGFGIAFVEASASGIPVVAGDSGGVRSAVRDGETGILVQPSDVGAYVVAIRKLLRNEALRKKMGAAGRAAVETHYNWDRVARETRAFTLKAVERWRSR